MSESLRKHVFHVASDEKDVDSKIISQLLGPGACGRLYAFILNCESMLFSSIDAGLGYFQKF